MKFSMKRFEKDIKKSAETKFDDVTKTENLVINRTVRIIKNSRDLSSEEYHRLNLSSEKCNKKTTLGNCELHTVKRAKPECSLCDANL